MFSRSFHSSINFFGGRQDAISKERLEIIENRNEGAMFVILSDVFLDKVSVRKPLIQNIIQVIF